MVEDDRKYDPWFSQMVQQNDPNSTQQSESIRSGLGRVKQLDDNQMLRNNLIHTYTELLPKGLNQGDNNEPGSSRCKLRISVSRALHCGSSHRCGSRAGILGRRSGSLWSPLAPNKPLLRRSGFVVSSRRSQPVSFALQKKTPLGRTAHLSILRNINRAWDFSLHKKAFRSLSFGVILQTNERTGSRIDHRRTQSLGHRLRAVEERRDAIRTGYCQIAVKKLNFCTRNTHKRKFVIRMNDRGPGNATAPIPIRIDPAHTGPNRDRDL